MTETLYINFFDKEAHFDLYMEYVQVSDFFLLSIFTLLFYQFYICYFNEILLF